MRQRLAPLAAVLGVLGVMSIGVAVAAGGARTHHDRIVAASSGPAFHDVQALNKSHGRTADSDKPVVQPPIEAPSCPAGSPSVHFDTPQAAMGYLAHAWNVRDYAALCTVTNPAARYLLVNMHREAVNLRLHACEKNGVGSYVCTFFHDYPARMHKSGHGRTWLDVAAAEKPGWYMTVYEGCG